jgi:O-antigen ligase
MWLNIGSGSSSRDEGNPFNATIDLLLIMVAFAVLARRRLRWSQAVKENGWLFAFYVFWAVSVIWSDDPFVTFKRVFRDFGNVLMVLIVLTEREPADAIKAVCVRIAYICVPLSIVLWKYYPGVGRSFTGYNGSIQMVVGVTTHKNSLGMLVMVVALFLLWDILSRMKQTDPIGDKWGMAADVFTLMMAWYLLTVVNSATSFVCVILGSALLIAFMAPSFSTVRRRFEVYAVAGFAVVGILSMTVDVKSAFFQAVERDETLTTRADMWPVLIDSQEDVLLGPGFNMFWSGERLKRLPEAYQNFLQAHNGYLETYLNGGVIGVTLLVIVLLSAYWRVRKRLAVRSPEWCLKMVIIVVAFVHNWTEASFNKLGLLWFVALFAMMVYSRTGDRGLRAMAYKSKSSGRIAHASTL